MAARNIVEREGGSVPEERVLALMQQAGFGRRGAKDRIEACVSAGTLRRKLCGARKRWPVLELPPE